MTPGRMLVRRIAERSSGRICWAASLAVACLALPSVGASQSTGEGPVAEVLRGFGLTMTEGMSRPERRAALLRAVTPDARAPERRPRPDPALAQLSANLQSILFALDDQDYEARERASRRLMDTVEVSDQDLVAMAWGAVTPEQERRVLVEHRRRFNTKSRAAMGVSFGVTREGRSINATRISQLIRNFPLHDEGSLRLGDLIVEINGYSLVDARGGTTINRARAAILSHDEYEWTEMIIRRPCETMLPPWLALGRKDCAHERSFIAAVPLGSWDNLPRSSRPTLDELNLAWRLSARRAGLPLQAALLYRTDAQRPMDHVISRSRMLGRSVDDILPVPLFRDENVRNFDLAPAGAANQDRNLAQRRALLAKRQVAREPAVVRAARGDRWALHGRDPEGNPATQITLIQRAGGEERYYNEGGAPIEIARRIADLRTRASAARDRAGAATDAAARDAALAQAANLEALATDLSRRLDAEVDG